MSLWTAYDLPAQPLPEIDTEATGVLDAQVPQFGKLAVAGTQSWAQLSGQAQVASSTGAQLAALRLSHEGQPGPYARALISGAVNGSEEDARLTEAGAWMAAVTWIHARRALPQVAEPVAQLYWPVTGCPACGHPNVRVTPHPRDWRPGKGERELRGGRSRALVPETPGSWIISLLGTQQAWDSDTAPLSARSLLQEACCLACALKLPLVAMIAPRDR